jgi:tetratricopeptide (TPR) repeat protein
VILVVTAGIFILIMKADLFSGVRDKVHYAFSVINGDSVPQPVDGRQNSIYERLYLWRNSMKLFSESRLTGIGLSDWQIYWPKYGMQGASYLDAAIMRYEHPHNEYVLFLAETGMAGLIAYLGFYLYFFILGIKIILSRADEINRRKTFVILAGISGLAILAFFGYPLHRPYTMALTVLLLLFIGDIATPIKKINSLIPVLIIACFSLFSLNVLANRLSGEFYMAKALQMQSNGNFPGMLRMIRKCENEYFTLDNSSTPVNWYKGFAMFYSGNDSALYYYKKAETDNPYHVQTLSDIGALLENQGKHEEAIQYFKRVVNITPAYYQAHYNLAVAYFNLGKHVEALKEINERTNVGDEYLNTLDVILARNAQAAADSCMNAERENSRLNDKPFLRTINRSALSTGKPFAVILCDSLNSGRY